MFKKIDNPVQDRGAVSAKTLEVSTSELNGWLDQWMKLVTSPKGRDDSAAKCPETGVAEGLSPGVFNQV